MKLKKIKHNKYPHVAEEELDLHGLFKAEARNAVCEFLEKAKINKYKRVRIITGKGWHSSEGKGILKDLVLKILNEKNISYSEAKINEGGSGAINIDL